MEQPPWWQRGVIYHIYPRSWMDSDGDGVGDLPGILARLDHLTWLGVDAVWISPVYPSPGADLGYDVADYTAIDPLFGTMEDMDRLIAAAHERGLRVLLDWVPNHTSDRHPWFLASRSGRDDPKRDWYVWRDPAPDGGPPTNWVGYAGQSAWCWDEATGQYYYRFFLDAQPDLNWRNPEVQSAMLDTLRFWLERGVDGFRIDVLSLLVEDDRLRDNPVNPEFREGDWPYLRQIFRYTHDQPETRELAMRIRKVVDEYGDDKVLLAELVVPIEALAAYHGPDGDGIQVPLNFELLEADWNARGIAAFVGRYLAVLPPGEWPNWVLGNHDTPRVASRLGPAQARVAAMLLLTLPGTPILYYGDEIGMTDVPVAPGQVRDPVAALIPGRGRDPERSPMRWDDRPGAGFTTGTPWLPLGDPAVNVAAQRDDPGSMLALHRRLLALRHDSPALSGGAYEPVQADGDLLAYLRTGDDGRWLVALNLGPGAGRLDVALRGRVELATTPDRHGERVEGHLHLAGDEGVVVRLAANADVPSCLPGSLAEETAR
jgi:alpha-glucosidase